MGIILDIIVLAIIALSIFASARYGFVRSIIELLGYIIAAVAVRIIQFPPDIGLFIRPLIFIALIVLSKVAAKLLNKLFSFSIVGKINRLLGGILGIPKGMLLALIFCMLTILIVTVSKDGFWIFTDKAVESSYIFKWIYSFLQLK